MCSCDFDRCNYNHRIPTEVPKLFTVLISVLGAALVFGIMGFAIYIYIQYKKLPPDDSEDKGT